jgi:hypothetical protein
MNGRFNEEGVVNAGVAREQTRQRRKRHVYNVADERKLDSKPVNCYLTYVQLPRRRPRRVSND